MVDGIIDQLKTCTKCGETKPLTEFYKRRAGEEDTRPACIACTKRLQPFDPIKFRARYIVKRNAAGKRGRPGPVRCSCENCFKEFFRKLSQVKNGVGKFCSRICCDTFKKRNHKPHDPPLTELLESDEKRCGACGVIQPLTAFRRRGNSWSSECIECLNKRCLAYYRQSHPFKVEPDLIGETWKDIEGYDGAYQVSNFGRVRRATGGKRTYQGRVVKLIPRCGYLRVFLYDASGKQRKHTVNRLVATAFIGPCPSGHEVNHLNGNKTDNSVENLEWVTHQQNMEHARTVLRVMGKH